MHGFLTVQIWKDFSLGWWNALASASDKHPPFWKFDTVDPTSPWFTRSCMKSHEWTFAKVGTTVHEDIFEVLIVGSLSCLYSWLPTALFYLHRGTSHIGSCWHVFSGRAALGLPFREFMRAWKLRNLSVRFRRQCFINPWIQTALFLIITIATTSAAVIWQIGFAGQGWILPIPLRLIILISRLYPTTVNKVWRLQCGQIF